MTAIFESAPITLMGDRCVSPSPKNLSPELVEELSMTLNNPSPYPRGGLGGVDINHPCIPSLKRRGAFIVIQRSDQRRRIYVFQKTTTYAKLSC